MQEGHAEGGEEMRVDKWRKVKLRVTFGSKCTDDERREREERRNTRDGTETGAK